MAPSQNLVLLSNMEYCKRDMLNLFRTTAETMIKMCSILDQYRSPFVELINTIGVSINLQEYQN